MTHRDLLRLAHPAGSVSAGNPTLSVSGEHARLFEWIVRGGDADGLPRIVEGYVLAQKAETAARSAELVGEYGLPREALKSEHLASPQVWEALLEDMPMTALVRNLATMTRVGVLEAGSSGTAKVVEQLGDTERIRRARVHPIAFSRPCGRTPRVEAREAGTSGARSGRSSTLSTRRSTPRSTASSRPARECSSRSTCRAR